MDPILVISIISTALKAVDTWAKVRDIFATSRTSVETFEAARRSPQIQAEAAALANLIPEPILKSMEARVHRCWDSYKDVIDSPEEYMPQEVDDATEALKRCVCRELRRIHKLNGYLPPGQLQDWWNQYCVV